MVTLRPITISEVDIFSKTAARSFIEAYRETETMDELTAFCEKHFSIEHLTSDLQSVDYQHVAAFLGDEMVGYLKLNLSVRPDGSRDLSALQIHRIYVLRDFWAHKIGAALMLKSMEIAVEIGAGLIWLVVYNKNQRAQDFYKKWGFEQTGVYDFDFNGVIHKDYIFELKLESNPWNFKK